jgi:CDP-diacylglycerol--glycerol-3-phosphate 3-phosphatidyltransferase
MPLPVAMILCDVRWVQIVAWALYIIIGVTDFFDGILARKYGFTRFGRLTDPIADKIYVALMFIPLALLGLIPPWVAVVILMRDPVITALRSMSERYGMTMKTATLAKYKTAIQMIAGGYIMFVGIVREPLPALLSMSALAGLAWSFHILIKVKKGKFDPRMWTMSVLMTVAVPIRLLFNVETSLIFYAMIILVVTWISAWNYLAGFLGGLRKAQKKPAGVWWLLYGTECIPVPLFVLILCFLPDVPVWLPMTILSIELAVGALDNILTMEGEERSPRHLVIKLGIQLLLVLAAIVMPVLPLVWPWGLVAPITLLAYGFGIVTLLSSVIAFARYSPRIL